MHSISFDVGNWQVLAMITKYNNIEHFVIVHNLPLLLTLPVRFKSILSQLQFVKRLIVLNE